MTNKFISLVDGNRSGIAPNLSTRLTRPDCVSFTSRLRVLPILLLCLTLILGFGNVWGDSKEWDFTTDALSSKSPITLTYGQGSASNNTTISSGTLRLYANRSGGNGSWIKFTAADGYEITAVSVTGGTNQTYSRYGVDAANTGAALTSSFTFFDGVATVSSLHATSFAIKNGQNSGSSNKTIQLAGITITYTSTASCTNTVSLSAGSATNGTISYAGSVETCGTGDNDRKVTISVAPSSGYTLLEATRPTFNKTSGAATASYVSGPTWNGSTNKYEYVYRFAKDDKGAGNFSVTCDALPKYKITYNAGTGSCGTTSWTQGSYQESTTLPTATPPATCSGWKFEGWCTSSAGDADDNTTSPGNILNGSYTPTADVTLYAVYTKTESGGTSDVDDELTYSTTGLGTGSGYTAWSNRTATTDAVYAGQSNQNVSYIQLRNQSPSGVISTTSGGTLKKIKIDWNSGTTNARSVTIYGKTTAYTASSDLYDSNKRGTELGTITKGTSTELTPSGSYTYIGILASAAVYIDKITITWTVGSSTTYYMTNLVCCSPLGQINGSFSLTHPFGAFSLELFRPERP